MLYVKPGENHRIQSPASRRGITVAKESIDGTNLIGTWDAIPKHLEHHLNTVGTDKIIINQLRKAVLLGTVYIL